MTTRSFSSTFFDDLNCLPLFWWPFRDFYCVAIMELSIIYLESSSCPGLRDYCRSGVYLSYPVSLSTVVAPHGLGIYSGIYIGVPPTHLHRENNCPLFISKNALPESTLSSALCLPLLLHPARLMAHLYPSTVPVRNAKTAVQQCSAPPRGRRRYYSGVAQLQFPY
jgi:hypothetical protein